MEEEAESRARDLKAAEEGGNGGTEPRSAQSQHEGPAARVRHQGADMNIHFRTQKP